MKDIQNNYNKIIYLLMHYKLPLCIYFNKIINTYYPIIIIMITYVTKEIFLLNKLSI